MARMNEKWMDAIYRRHYDEMVALATSLLRDAEEAKDVVGDVFTRLAEGGISVDDDKWQGYLMASVRHRCRDIIAHRQVRDKVCSQLPREEAVAAQEEYHERPDVATVLDYADHQLEPRTRDILQMRVAEQKTYREIASTMGISIPAVFKHLRRAGTKLKAQFIAVSLILGVVLVAVGVGLHRHAGSTVPATKTIVEPSAAPPKKQQTPPAEKPLVVFENVELGEIVETLAAHYHLRTDIRNEQSRHLRLYFQWDKRREASQVVGQLNAFEQVEASIEGDAIVIH